MASQVEVVGLRKVVTQLQRLGTQAEDLKGAFTRIGSRAVTHAQRGAPKRTGRLAGSVRQSRRKNSVYLYAGRARLPYAGPIHFGWPARNIKANPWMYRTVDDVGPWAVKELEREIATLIRRLDLNG